MRIAVILVLIASWAAPAIAQQQAAADPKTPAAQTSNDPPSSKAAEEADQKTLHAAAAPISGDTDRDFVAEMIAHNQTAVDMAKAELQNGKDPEMRHMASGIIQSQARQIAQMKAWRLKRDAKD